MKRDMAYSVDALLDKLEELEAITSEYNKLARMTGDDPMARTGFPKYLYTEEYCRKEKMQLLSFAEKEHLTNLEHINCQLPYIYMFTKERIELVREAYSMLLKKSEGIELAKIA